MALSVVLLIGAGLFIRSLIKLQSVDTGFNKENVLVLGVDTDAVGYENDDDRLARLYQQVEQRAGAIPGVRAASFSMFTFNQGEWSSYAYAQGHTPPAENERTVQNNIVGPGFMDAMGVPVLLGRGLGSRDTRTSPKVAVINETMARRFFAGEPPVGQRFGLEGEHSGDIKVAGVVKDAKYESLGEKSKPAAYYPYTQRIQYLGNFVVRFSGDARVTIPQVRSAIGEVNHNLPIAEIRTLAEQVDESLASQKLIAHLSSFFGLLALLLACVGIYGIMSYAVERRTSEIGIRMALGARRTSVVWLVMRDSLALVAFGLAVGVPAALGIEYLLSRMLFGLKAVDPITISAAVAVLLAVAGLAAYLPARSASLVDPTVALRYE